jgi:hypothetical protein
MVAEELGGEPALGDGDSDQDDDKLQPVARRIVIIGCAGSGKTTLARALAVRLDAHHLERDALGDDEAPGFATQVAAALDAAGSRWVFDGAPYNAELVVTGRPTPWSRWTIHAGWCSGGC